MSFVKGSWALGVLCVRIGQRAFFLRAPWDEPLFSERNRLDSRIPLGFGWRITVRADF